MRKSSGIILNTVISFIFVFTFLVNVLCYLGIFLKMRSIQRKVSGGHATTGESIKNLRVARIMMIFVLVYLLQFWAYLVYSMWLVFAEPSIAILWGTVFFTNLGGVLNMFAYTLLRRRSLRVQLESQGTMFQNHSTTSTRSPVVKTQKF